MVVTKPYLDHKFESLDDVPFRLLESFETDDKEFPDQQVVVLSRILSSAVTIPDDCKDDMVVSKVNGSRPKNLEHMVEMVERWNKGLLRFDLDGDKKKWLSTWWRLEQRRSIFLRCMECRVTAMLGFLPANVIVVVVAPRGTATKLLLLPEFSPSVAGFRKCKCPSVVIFWFWLWWRQVTPVATSGNIVPIHQL